MDLPTVSTWVDARDRGDLAVLGPGAVPLAGGTWLMSTPDPRLHTLVDLTGLGWEPVTATADGLEVAATCTIAQLHAWTPPDDWTAFDLVEPCCRALASSDKIWRTATVGGNVALGLAAGSMTTLFATLDATALVWSPAGEREVPVADLVVGDARTTLAADEVLRSLRVGEPALRARTAFRRVSLAVEGRSGAIVTGRRDPDGSVVVVLTAGTTRPVVVRLGASPSATALGAAIDDVGCWHDDVHGSPRWRRAMSHQMAAEVLDELVRP